jgi:phosphomevalonate kinase
MEKVNLKISTKSPGKILICGGYVVISPKFKGLVLTTDTYFKCDSEVINYNIKDSLGDLNKLVFNYSVMSNQLGLTYSYCIEYLLDKSNKINISKVESLNNNLNEFVKNSLIVTTYMFILYNHPNIINKLNADKSLELSIKFDLDADHRFYSYKEIINDINTKTGLGSSSALVTSLVTNLYIILELLFTNKPSGTTFNSLEIEQQANILLSALVANNQAQNKVR